MGSFVCFESVTFLGQTGLELVTLLHPLPRCWEFPEIDKILGGGGHLTEGLQQIFTITLFSNINHQGLVFVD